MTTNWYVVFEDDPQKEETFEKRAQAKDMLERFDVAVNAGKLVGRDVRGMWIIDAATEQVDVLRRYGRCPIEINDRFKTRMAIAAVGTSARERQT